MSILIPLGGVTALSGLTIDADKDWSVMGISNIERVTAAPTRGDLTQKGGGGIMVNLTPGPIGYVITSHGAGNIVSFDPPIHP